MSARSAATNNRPHHPQPANSDGLSIVRTSQAQQQSVKACNKYLIKHPLVNPPFGEGEKHDKRFKRVCEYFDSTPRLCQSHESAVVLFKKVYHVAKEQPNWQEENRCLGPASFCLVPADTVFGTILQKCVVEMHMRNGPDRLLQCPMCKVASKPVYLAWLRMSAEERDQKKKNHHAQMYKARRLTVEGRRKERERQTNRAREKAARAAGEVRVETRAT
ncbi:hypothetical protein DFH09DRAFT_1342454 [Mycena vulgaris]|nr:hypothetical protein DFH09DRAFT_1342454 [Mycena vulgaris]